MKRIESARTSSEKIAGPEGGRTRAGHLSSWLELGKIEGPRICGERKVDVAARVLPCAIEALAAHGLLALIS
jgi:hypothetical protein